MSDDVFQRRFGGREKHRERTEKSGVSSLREDAGRCRGWGAAERRKTLGGGEGGRERGTRRLKGG